MKTPTDFETWKMLAKVSQINTLNGHLGFSSAITNSNLLTIAVRSQFIKLESVIRCEMSLLNSRICHMQPHLGRLKTGCFRQVFT